ncbi:MAG: lysophospholipid acyltransferase family protein [Bacteroidetes bacterium]|nr:lysophospholipid acyltransferase family protein [Bacteroidota bacterium]MBS1628610.1 lysophospholipid acyltransferase family protein [Bacteroidota bacterium]
MLTDEQQDSTEAWAGRSRGTSIGYRIFIELLRRAGLRAAYALLRPVGLYYRVFAKSATAPLRYLYEQRLGFPKAKSQRLIRRNIYFFGQTLIDKIAVLTGAAGKLSFTHEGVHHLEQLAASGTGGLVVSAHLGNWEIAGHMLKRVNARIHVLMYDGEAEQLKALMTRYDQQRSFNIIYLREDLSHVYEMAAALRRGELICLHADRFRPGNRTFIHPFLGEDAHFPAGPFLLASKLRAPVCFVFALKETNFHYHYKSWAAKTYEGRGDIGARCMLDDFVRLLEQELHSAPDQWFNYYDFWQAKP